jgi:glycosyltransferase involved in cell wall biosynthesis
MRVFLKDSSEKRFNIVPAISIIIPFFGRDLKSLRSCLYSIKKQNYPLEKIEIIIIDNNLEPVLDYSSLMEIIPLVILYEPRPGSYKARNSGLRQATGSVIVFTDSDCRSDPQWLRTGYAKLMGVENCGLVAGNIVITFEKPDRPNCCELYDHIIHFRQETYLEKMHFGATANVFSCREVIEVVGYFNEKFYSGGDREWGERVWRAGYKQLYAADAIVYHPARNRLWKLCKKARRLIGQEYIRTKETENSRSLFWSLMFSELEKAASRIQFIWAAKKGLHPYLLLKIYFTFTVILVARLLELFRLVFYDCEPVR